MSWTIIAIAVLFSFTFYTIGTWIYRLTFHPLARFPGPKIFAMTSLYSTFIDILDLGPPYISRLPAMHDKYGPIVRAWPNELHIRDDDAYNQIFKVGTKFHKEKTAYIGPLAKGSLNLILETKPAQARRTMISGSFSKEAIRRAEPQVQDYVTKFLTVLQKAVDERTLVDLSLGFMSLTADVVMNHAFQRPLGATDTPNFEFQLVKSSDRFMRTIQLRRLFPNFFDNLLRLSGVIPLTILRVILPGLGHTQWFRGVRCCDFFAFQLSN